LQSQRPVGPQGQLTGGLHHRGRHIGRTGLHRRAGLVLGHVVKFLSGGHGLHRRQPAVPQDRHCQLPAVDPLLRQDLGAVAQHLLQ
ncbi:hypothetical protein LLOABG_LLOABG_01600, partial [Dysosmobacter welbionis]